MAPRHPGTPVRQISLAEKDALLKRATEVLRAGQPTFFAHEGLCRHWLRARFCLKGHPHAEADRAAAEIVGRALKVLGARRPQWGEGQPEWTQPGVLNPGRTTCANCGKELPEGHYRFCSKVCGSARRIRTMEADARRAELAFTNRAVLERRRSSIPDRTCLHCREPFQPRTLGRPEDKWCPDCQEAGRAA